MNASQLQEKKENTKYLMDTVTSWIENIDKKISYALALTSALLGFILSKGRPSIFTIFSNGASPSFSSILGLILIILLYCISFFTILMFLLAISCRIKSKSGIQSLLYFGSIQKMPLQTFVEQYDGMDNKEYIHQMLEQIHTNSTICTKKAKCYNLGIITMSISFALFLVCLSIGWL